MRAPQHDRGCLFPAGLCRCSRGDWLDERVPRAQARVELLDELARWAHEQRLLAESELVAPDLAGPGKAGWRRAAVRAGAHMAEETFLDVRRRALAQQEECAARPAADDQGVHLTGTEVGALLDGQAVFRMGENGVELVPVHTTETVGDRL